jgi:3-oxoacyl-[acyl-carrier protein] reductase
LPGRPVALVTGVGRTAGIGAGIASQLAASGRDIAFTYWTAYDARMTWGVEAGATDAIEGAQLVDFLCSARVSGSTASS